MLISLEILKRSEILKNKQEGYAFAFVCLSFTTITQNAVDTLWLNVLAWRGVWLARTDWILVMILITIRIQEFFNGIFTTAEYAQL